MDAPRQAGWERNALSDVIVPEICTLFARAYAGEERLDHAEVSPVIRRSQRVQAARIATRSH